MPILSSEDLVDWFDARVRLAAAQTRPLHPDTLMYLVALLAGHVRPSDGIPNDTLAEMYLRAGQAPVRERGEAFRVLGDHALLTLGWFPASVERKIVSPSYYVEMGAGAYAEADRWFYGAFGLVFRDLATSFEVAVQVLNTVKIKDENPLFLASWLRGTSA